MKIPVPKAINYIYSRVLKQGDSIRFYYNSEGYSTIELKHEDEGYLPMVMVIILTDLAEIKFFTEMKITTPLPAECETIKVKLEY